MNHMSLMEHMKTLKAAIPIKQRQPEHTSQLPIFRVLKDLNRSKQVSNEGIFKNLSFCLPLLDTEHDPSKEQITKLVKGLFVQGAEIIEFNERMSEVFSNLVVVSEQSKVDDLRDKLRGLVKYQMIVSYKFVEMSLKSLKRMKVEDYLLYDNTNNLQKETASIEVARQKLKAETIPANLKRARCIPKNELTVNPDLDQAVTQSMESQKLRIKTAATLSNQTDKPTEQLSYQQFSGKGMGEIEQDYEDLEEIAEQPQLQKEIQTNYQNNQKTEAIEPEKGEEKMIPSQNQSESKQANQEEKVEKREGKEANKQKKKVQEKDKYHRNQNYKPKEIEGPKQKQPRTDEYDEADALCPWEPKGDRKRFWYIPPKNLASHSFPNNIRICNKLSQLQQIYRRNRDTRNFLYLKVITILKSHNKQILCPEDLEAVQGLSKGMKDKITEIINTGELARLKRYSVKEENNVCQELEKVWGIGSTKAKELYDMGIKTVEDLKKRPDLITKNVAVGLKYFDQFAQRIPRDKVTRIFQTFKSIFYSQVLSDKMHNLEVVGSYRRGKATCGDIDILICRHDGSVQPRLLQNLVMQLQRKKFITESLSHPRLFDGKNSSAYMGVCLFENKHHRIDIKHYPVEEYAFALMYFTGSDIFNRQMRMVAHNKGLMLSDHGIKKKERNGKSKIWKGGEIPVLKTEEQIFKFFGQEFCTPAEREI